MQVHLCFGRISHQGKDDNTGSVGDWEGGKAKLQLQICLGLPSSSPAAPGPQGFGSGR